MATTEEKKILEQILAKLDKVEGRQDRIEAQLGIPQPRKVIPEKERADYIEHESPEHAALLGLMAWDSKQEAEEAGYSVLMRPHKKGQWYSDKYFSLGDEVGPFERSPDPEKACRNVLRQKLSSLESGRPEPYPGAPTRWMTPEEQREFTPLN